MTHDDAGVAIAASPHFKSISASRPDIAHGTWAARNNVELCFIPTYASWADPDQGSVEWLRPFIMGASNVKLGQAGGAPGRRRHFRIRVRTPVG